MKGRGQMVEQEGQGGVDRRLVDQVIVVEDEHEVIGQVAGRVDDGG